MVNSAGIITTIAGTGDHGSSGDGGPAAAALLGHPYGVSVDGTSSKQKLYIVDTDNREIRVMVLPVPVPVATPTPVPIAAPTTIPPKTSPGNLINFAGTGVSGNSGDGGAATSAQITLNSFQPTGVAMDVNGNVYFVDYSNHKVRKVTAAGIITTYAGTGTSGSNGDNGAATSAQLHAPTAVSVDVKGNAYVADTYNNKIRMVNSAGIITTFAGTGQQGNSGDGGLATAAQLSRPTGLAIDVNGILYIIDNESSLVRKVSTTGIITNFAGTGASGSSGDSGLASAATFGYITAVSADIFGKLYIADTDNNNIRMVSGTGIITTFAGMVPYGGDGGAATSALMNQPRAVSADGNGNVYIVDFGNNRIRKVSSSGIITTFAGTGTQGSSGDGGQASLAQFYYAFGISADSSGNVFIVDAGNNKIRKVNSAGIISTYAGTGTKGSSGDGGQATLAQLANPYGCWTDQNGNVYIADTVNGKIRKVNVAGIIATYAGTGTQGTSGDNGPASLAQLGYPYGGSVDGNGNVYIADSGNGRIRKVNSAGIIATFAGGGSSMTIVDGSVATSAQYVYAYGISTDQNGNVYIADTGNNKIRKVNNAGIITTFAGTGQQGNSGDNGPATSAQLTSSGVSVDISGNVYIVDQGNDKIRKVSNTGIITTYAGKGLSGGDGGPATFAPLSNPAGVAADVYGNVHIADTNNNRIRMVNSAGIITTTAGTGEYGSSGDGGAASLALLGHPYGVSVDNNQNIYIVDAGNNKIRVMVLPVTTTPTSTTVSSLVVVKATQAISLQLFPFPISAIFLPMYRADCFPL